MGQYKWSSVEDVDAEQRQAEARRDEQRVQQERNARAWAQYQARRAADWEDFWSGVRKWATVGGIFLVLVWIVRKREPILRWYYFTFHPHPAEPIVRSALKGGRTLDGNALAAVLGDLPPTHGVFRSVRVAQGEQLVAKMRVATEAMIATNLARAQTDYERAAFHDIQEALGLAAVALERARAAEAASKSLQGRRI
jgi:hypothetical protein